MNLGLIGCGRAARGLHLPAIQRAGGFRVQAAADPDRGALKKACVRFRIPFGYADAMRLLRRTDLSALALCVPPERHAAAGEEALAAGKPLFIEKPAGLTPEDNGRLADAARRAGIPVLVGFNLRHHRFVRRARAWLRAGALDPVVAVRSTFVGREENLDGWRGQPGLGGGILRDLAVHHFDLFRFLFDSELEDVSAKARPGWLEVRTRMAGGISTESFFRRGPQVRHELEIVGPMETLRLSLYDFDGFRLGSSRMERWRERATALPRALIEKVHGGVYMDSYRAQWEHFAAVARGEAMPAAALEDAGRALEAAVAAEKSLAPRSADETQEVVL